MSHYAEVGPVRVKRMTNRAVLLHEVDPDLGLDVGEGWWVPFSVMSEDSLACLEEGALISEVEVASWYAEREGIR